MNMKKILISIIIGLIVLIGCIMGYSHFAYRNTPIVEQGVKIEFKVNVREGLKQVNVDCPNANSSGGAMNADEILLKFGETLDYMITKDSLGSDKIEDLKLKIDVVDDDGKEHSAGTVTFNAKVNDKYHISINGDKANGFIAKYAG